MRRTLRLAVLAAAAAAAGTAHAEKSYLALAATQTEDKSEAQNQKGRDLVTIVSATAAYVMAGGLSLGGKYFHYNHNGRTTEGTGTVVSGWGPLIGYYHKSGVFANAAYLIYPEKVYEDDAGKTTFFDGTGYVIDIGKVFEFGAWGAGLQLSYSKVEYEKVRNARTGEASLTGAWSDTSLYPYLNVFVYL